MQYEPETPPHVGLSFSFHFLLNVDLLNEHNGDPQIRDFLSYFTLEPSMIGVLDVSDVFFDRKTVLDYVSPKYILAGDGI